MRIGSTVAVPSSLIWILSSTAWTAFASGSASCGEAAPVAITVLAAWILLASRIPKVLSRPAFVPF
jgi:hypothetical protein